jgi:molecular chaperone GrpE
MTPEELEDHSISSAGQPLTDDDLQEDLARALTLAEENLAGWKRTQADFENFRRRKESESGELIGIGKNQAFSQLLPVIDSLSQALVYAPEVADEKYQQWKQGLNGIVKQLDTALAEAGITKIDALGKSFDPNLHEAVREVPGDEDGIVAEQYQQGYQMDGRVIRPAQVAITKKVGE